MGRIIEAPNTPIAMPVKARRCSARALALFCAGAALALLSGCAGIDDASKHIAAIVTPYRVDVVQGNFVAREQVDALQPGMSRQQVREILGTPLVSSLFHADRWDYVFTLKRPGQAPQTRRLTVFFNGDALLRSEGDSMPSETEFVATLDAREARGQVPVLEATPEQLARYPARPEAAQDDADSREQEAEQPAAAASASEQHPYPPLEAPAR